VIAWTAGCDPDGDTPYTKSAVNAFSRAGAYPKGDERMREDGGFVEKVLAQADERLQNRHQLTATGHDLEKLVLRVSDLMDISRKEIVNSRKQRKSVSPLCCWASGLLGTSRAHLATFLSLS
jgi:hypothetical protein